MGRYRGYVVIVLALVTIGLTLVWADDHASSHARDDNDSSRLRLVSESALLAGLEGKTVFPFIDTTPKGLRRAHVAITDSTANCAPGAAAPSNIQILVGEAGVALVNVMTEATNTESPCGRTRTANVCSTPR